MRSLLWFFVVVAALVVSIVLGGCAKARQDTTERPAEVSDDSGVWRGTPAGNAGDETVSGANQEAKSVDGVWGGTTVDEAADGSVHELTDSDFEDEVINSPGYVVVDFNADWCGPCQSLKPVYHDLAAEYRGQAKFVSVNVDDCPRIAQTNKVRGIPDVRIFKDGKQVSKKVGFGGERDFRGWVAETLK